MAIPFTPLTFSNNMPSGYALDENFADIKSALQSALSREHSNDNEMKVDLDMNARRILNLPEPRDTSEAARLADVRAALESSAANLVEFTPYDFITADNVQGAVEQAADKSNERYNELSNELDDRVIYVGSVAELSTITAQDETTVNVQGTTFVYDSASTSWKVRGNILVTSFGAIPDSWAADQTDAVYDALVYAGAADADIEIPRGIKWDYNSAPTGETLTVRELHPFNVAIYDCSGWDYEFLNISAASKIIQNTDNPGAKNAHEFILTANWNPGMGVDVDSKATPAEIATDPSKGRSSFVWRRDGRTKWQMKIDPGTDGSSLDGFNLARFDALDGSGSGNVLRINHDYAEVAWNKGSVATPGTTWSYRSKVEDTAIFDWEADASEGHSWQYSNVNTGILHRMDIAPDGTRTFFNAGGVSVAATITDDYKVSGLKHQTEAKTTSYSINNSSTKRESGKWFTNEGATGGFIFTLPDATPGQSYMFFVIAAQNLRVSTQTGDNFRGLADGDSRQSVAVGDFMEVFCATTGVWEIRETGTGWATF